MRSRDEPSLVRMATKLTGTMLGIGHGRKGQNPSVKFV